jgi:hypothetical protein
MAEFLMLLPDDVVAMIQYENLIPADTPWRHAGENGRDGYVAIHGDVMPHRDTPPNENAAIHRQQGSHETKKEKRKRRG